MYSDRPRDLKAEADEFKARIRALVEFVMKWEKDGNGYSATLMDLVDGYARLESSVSWLSEQQNKDRPADTYAIAKANNTIELPNGTRKVSIEL